MLHCSAGRIRTDIRGGDLAFGMRRFRPGGDGASGVYASAGSLPRLAQRTSSRLAGIIVKMPAARQSATARQYERLKCRSPRRIRLAYIGLSERSCRNWRRRFARPCGTGGAGPDIVAFRQAQKTLLGERISFLSQIANATRLFPKILRVHISNSNMQCGRKLIVAAHSATRILWLCSSLGPFTQSGRHRKEENCRSPSSVSMWACIVDIPSRAREGRP